MASRCELINYGAPVFLVFNPKTWVAVQRQRVTGVFRVADAGAGPWDVLDALELDYTRMTEEFFTTLEAPTLYGH